MIPVDVLDDREVDQLLEGHVPPGRDELAPLAAIVASIRAAFSARSDDRDAIGRHRPVIRRLAALTTTDNGDPAAMPVSKVDRPRHYEVSGLPKWRRFPVSALLTSLLSSVAGKVAVGAVTLAAVTGVVATTTDQEPDKVVVSTVSDTEDDTTTTVASTDTTDTTETTTADTTVTTTETTTDSSVVEEPAPSEAQSEVEEGDTAVEAKDNHGAVVSEAAKDHSHDEECGNHGRYVSSVARGEESCTPPPGQAKKEAAAVAPEAGDVEAELDAEGGEIEATEPGPPAHAQAKGHAKQNAKSQDG